MNIETQHWNLIARYLKGALSDQERDELSEWVNASHDNKKVFEQVKNLWIATDNVPEFEVDVDSNWSRFQETVNAKNQTKVIQFQKEKEKQAYWPLLYRVAAVLVVGLLLTFFLRESLVKEELIVLETAGEKREFVLPDSSTVFLNKNSRLTYDADFNKSGRVVRLQGEAFFDIKKAGGQRFIVYAKNSKTEVLGTSFSVSSFENNDDVEVKVVTGKVAFSLHDESNTVFLEPGKKGVLEVTSESVREAEIEDANFLSWKTERLIFDNADFQEVINDLESHYDVQIEVASSQILSCRYSGTFERSNIQNTLEVISATMNVSIKKENNAWIVSGEGCK